MVLPQLVQASMDVPAIADVLRGWPKTRVRKACACQACVTWTKLMVETVLGVHQPPHCLPVTRWKGICPWPPQSSMLLQRFWFYAAVHHVCECKLLTATFLLHFGPKFGCLAGWL
jgi:hypothetical protein